MSRLAMNTTLGRLLVSIAGIVFASQLAHAQPAGGGPPNYPIARTKPRLYDATITANIFAEGRDISDIAPLLAKRSEVVVPIILQGAYSKVDPSTITIAGQINGRTHAAGTVPWTLRGPHPDGTAEIVVEFVDIQAQSMGITMTWREQSWLADINEADAFTITWPAEWPEAVKPYLQPGPWIQSDDKVITDFVARITQGNLRNVTPYSAAKELMRKTITAFNSISGTGNERRDLGQIEGLQLIGAAEATRTATGSPNDLACTCVAVLRAAGIPARPVIGIVKEITRELEQRTQWRTWVEFYLPKAGWVPFDPNQMRGSGFQFKALDAPWPGFANIKDLDERIPVAYRFQPTGSQWNRPPVWGWLYDGNVNRAWKIFPQTSLMRISRGPGIPDP